MLYSISESQAVENLSSPNTRREKRKMRGVTVTQTPLEFGRVMLKLGSRTIIVPKDILKRTVGIFPAEDEPLGPSIELYEAWGLRYWPDGSSGLVLVLAPELPSNPGLLLNGRSAALLA